MTLTPIIMNTTVYVEKRCAKSSLYLGERPWWVRQVVIKKKHQPIIMRPNEASTFNDVARAVAVVGTSEHDHCSNSKCTDPL